MPNPATTETTNPPSEEKPTGQQPAASAAGTTPAGEVKPAADTGIEDEDDEEEGASTKITLTSKQIKDRLNRATTKERKELFAELGVETIEEAKALAEKARKAELDKLSDTERLEAQLADEKKARETAEKTLKRLQRDQEEQEATNFLQQTAQKQGVSADALELVLHKAQKFIAENFDDDHELTEKDLKPFFKDLKAEKKAWFDAVEVPASTHSKEKNPPASNQVAPATPPKDIMSMTDAEWAAEKRRRGLR